MVPVQVHQFPSQQSLVQEPASFFTGVLWQVPQVIEHDGGNLLVGRRMRPRLV